MIEACNPQNHGFLDSCGQFAKCSQNIYAPQYTCIHDPPFTASPGLIATYVVIPILCGLGVVGGLGGGVLKGPVVEVILNYSQKMATEIAYCFMFGGTLLNTSLLIFEKNPDDEFRPIINFRVAVIFNLAIPFATSLGSTLQAFLPGICTLVLQTLFLCSISPILWKNAQKAKADELKEKQKSLLPEGEKVQQKIELNQIDTKNMVKKSISQSLSNQTIDYSILERFKSETESILPKVPLLLIFGSFTLNQILLFMRSSDPKKSSYVGISDCTWENDFMFLILFLANFVYGFFVWKLGSKQEQQFDQINYLPKERYYTPVKKFIILYLGGFLAGLASGFLGMGVGFILVPALLSCGLKPRVASATCGLLMLMSSLENLITLLTIDKPGWQIIVLFTGLAMIGGSVIAKICYYFLKKYKIGYIVILIVFGLAISNIFSQVYYGVVNGFRFGIKYLTATTNECNISD